MKDVKIKAKNLWFWALVGDAYSNHDWRDENWSHLLWDTRYFDFRLSFTCLKCNEGLPFFAPGPGKRGKQFRGIGVWTQRQETLDLPYLTLLCDNLKNRMFPQNFFSWRYFGNLLYCSSYPHHSTIPQPNNFIRDCRIRLLGQKRMFTAKTSVFLNYMYTYYIYKKIWVVLTQ
jgi:hypothetical protein